MGKLTELLSKRKVIILDSAMGTELQKLGSDTSLPLWSSRAIVDHPDTIRQLYIDNIDAGADIITTNTFRTQKRTFEKAGYKYENYGYERTAKELTTFAVDIAREGILITHDNVLVAGGMAPLEDCYKPELVPPDNELYSEHKQHCENLMEAGVDCILAETLSSLREIEAIIKVNKEFASEFMISLLCKDENTLLSGEPFTEAISTVNDSPALALMVNCIRPELGQSLLEKLNSTSKIPTGIYANVCTPGENPELKADVTASEYYKFARIWRKLGTRIIGGCCCTTPEYIKKISTLKK